MGRSIGSLGTEHDAVDLSFDYFGVVIKVNESASDLDLVGFMLEAAGIDKVDETKAMVAIRNYLVGLIDPGDWDTFWRTAKANRQNMDDLMTLGQQIIEAVSGGFPTPPLSDSRSGAANTSTRSRDGSSSPAGSRQVRRAAKKTAAKKATPRKTAAKAPQRAVGARGASPQAQAMDLLPEARRGDIGEFYAIAQEVQAERVSANGRR